MKKQNGIRTRMLAAQEASRARDAEAEGDEEDDCAADEGDGQKVEEAAKRPTKAAKREAPAER